MTPLELVERLPFCGCGRVNGAELVHQYLLHLQAAELIVEARGPIADLREIVAWYREHPSPEHQWLTEHGALGEVIAHIACDAGLTDHGESVFAAWLTDDGRAAIALWNERGTDDWAWEDA